MASQNPPKKGVAYTTYVSLVSQANTKIMQANPTLAAGDVKVAIDDGAPDNPATLPVVDADFTKRVKVSLSAAEMNGDNISVIFSDASGAEWCDLVLTIPTVANQFDDLATSTALATINGYLDTEIAAIKLVTDQLTAAQAEPVAVPAANASPLAKLAWIAMLARNKLSQTGTVQSAYADNGSAVVATATVADDGSTATRGKFA